MVLQDSTAFSGFSVNDIAAAKQFYSITLGLQVEETAEGMTIHLHGGLDVFVYPKPDHEPASFTILNFVVGDIDTVVDSLADKGVTFEHYDGTYQDAKGVARGKSVNRGPNIAWFKDPAGNVLAVVEK